jgi:methyl-accepting chemotaxis protein
MTKDVDSYLSNNEVPKWVKSFCLMLLTLCLTVQTVVNSSPPLNMVAMAYAKSIETGLIDVQSQQTISDLEQRVADLTSRLANVEQLAHKAGR